MAIIGLNSFVIKSVVKKWFEENITEEAREKGNEAFAQLSEKWRSEEFVDGLQKGLSRIQRIFKNVDYYEIKQG